MKEQNTFGLYLSLILTVLVVMLAFSNLITPDRARDIILIRIILLSASVIVGVFILFNYISSRE